VLQRAFELFRVTLLRCLPWSLFAVLVGHLPALAAPHTAAAWVLIILAGLINLWAWLMVAVRQTSHAALATDAARTLRLLPRALGLLLLVAAIVTLGTLLVVIPGLYLAVACWPALAVLVLEDTGVRQSIDRSLQLVRGHWWHVASCLLVALLLVLGFFVVGGLAGFVLADFLPSVLVTSLLAGLFQPLVCAFGISQYRELCTRHSCSSANNSL
jgi:hypothetical protein